MPQSSVSEFTAYYEKHKDAIFNYLLYRVAFQRDVAEDLTSEIFLKAYQAFERYDRNRSFKTWIFAIAHNHLVNHYASNRKHVPLDEAVGIVKESHIEEEAEHRMLLGKILHFLSELPEPQQTLITMRYVEDLSNREIAEILGKDEGAVRTGLSRAIAALRELYQQHLTQTHHE